MFVGAANRIVLREAATRCVSPPRRTLREPTLTRIVSRTLDTCRHGD